MFFRKILNKMTVRQNIRHGLRHYFPACHVIGKAGCLLCLHQVVHILPSFTKGIENHLSEFIVLHRVPLFNKMCELMGKSAQHCIFCQIANIVLAVKACVDVDVNGAGFASFESALGALEIPTCIHFRLIQHNVNAGSFCKSTAPPQSGSCGGVLLWRIAGIQPFSGKYFFFIW